jgi:hypothetical protein
MMEPEVRSLFTLAGFSILKLWRLENKYWTMTPEHYELCATSPWWLVRTEFGLIEIGWRKRVISIDWSDTEFRVEVTNDDVMKNDVTVHAWSIPKALEYLIALRAYVTTHDILV